MLTVVSWNVRSLRDDAAAVARVLREADPDVVLLQEAPRFPLVWWWPLFVLQRRTGLRLVPGGRPRAGLAALVRPELVILHADRVLLAPEPGLHRRGLMRLMLPGVVLATTHLDLDRGARLRHAAQIDVLLGAEQHVLTGDLNERPGGPTWAALLQGRTDAGAAAGATFPAAAPRARIDAVLLSPGVAGAVEVIDTGDVRAGSDHLALRVRLDHRAPRVPAG